jgi:hypothetical protein
MSLMIIRLSGMGPKWGFEFRHELRSALMNRLLHRVSPVPLLDLECTAGPTAPQQPRLELSPHNQLINPPEHHSRTGSGALLPCSIVMIWSA